MKRLLSLGFVGTFLLTATGCGGSDSAMREYIVNLNIYAATLEKKESKERQQAAIERIKTIIEKIDKLNLSKEDREKLIKKHESDFNKAKERINTAEKNRAMEGEVTLDSSGIFGGFDKQP